MAGMAFCTAFGVARAFAPGAGVSAGPVRIGDVPVLGVRTA